MNKITDELYERFKKNLESVNGTCVRTSKENLGKAVAGIFTEAGIPDTCIVETPLMKEGGVISALEEAGIKVYTDHIRLNAETVKGGVSESQYGIADLGTNPEHLVCKCLINQGSVGETQEYAIGMLFTKADQVFFANQRLPSGIYVHIDAQFFALTDDAVNLITGKI